ncbi:hypothetical protein EDD11_003148 [Mortierella claussenii]|nr:hypothetical protein EDD11_003148 [Mortierella claussenii]
MVSQAMRQIILISVICFGTIGMFNAMSSIGNAGKHSPTAQNLAVTASSIAYIIGFLLAGGTHNMIGPRPCVAFGGLTFFLYAGAMMLVKDNEHSLYPLLAGVLLGLGAGCIWVTQGAMMMSYPTEDNKGKYIACFWAIFNLGAVLGSVFPLVMNSAPGMDPDDVSPSTYIVYMVLMGCATFLAFFLVRPSSIVRDDGEPVFVAKFAGVKAEFMAILSVFCDWRMLLLIPAFFFSNFSYTYQFNDFNGFSFNIRTRSLNSIIFWVAQIIGALLIGILLDRLPMKRPKRAVLGLLVVALLFNATWVGALMMQLKHNWERKISTSKDLIDYEHGQSYSGPLTIYVMFGFCDAAFAVYCYWLMGALSNKHDELSRYAGFFKSIQSLGSAVAAPLDLAQTPLLAYLLTNWILCVFSIAAMFLVCRTITDTTVDDDSDNCYDHGAEDGHTERYEVRSNQPGMGATSRVRNVRQRPSLNGFSCIDGNQSTISDAHEGGVAACRSWVSKTYDDNGQDLEGGYECPHRLSSSRSGPGSHDSYMSSTTAVSSHSHGKRRSSSVLSAASMANRTSYPSPTFQHSQQNVRGSVSRLSRAPSMAEIQNDTSYLNHYQQHQRLSVPPLQGPNRIPSIFLTTDNSLASQSGIESLTPDTLPHPSNYLDTTTPTAALSPSSTSAATMASLAVAPRFSFGGASSSGSTRYDEEQDMDSVDTCSLSSMSSGHDSMPEMSDMGLDPEPSQAR